MSTGYSVDDRLRNWARWHIRQRLGGGNYARPTVEERVDESRVGWDAAAIVSDDEADAIDIDQAVHGLEEQQRTVILVHYVRNDQLKVKLQLLKVEKTRYYELVRMAGRKVEEQVAQVKALRAARARTERERLKPVMEAARP